MAITPGSMGQKIAQVYIEVQAKTSKAAEEFKKLQQAAERDLKDSKDRLKANKEFLKLKEKNIGLTKKELADVAKHIKADKNATRESISNLRKKVVEQYIAAKKNKVRANINVGIEKMMDTQIRRVWTNFTDWTGQQFKEQGEIRKNAQGKAITDYKSFLNRASREESRFANKLDQRDMTKSVIENARRGFAKGLLISEKWHKDENQLQRISRGLGIAGGSMERIKSFSERAADGFYKLQRVGFTLQAGLSVIGSTLGSLVGGFLGLIGVLAQAGAAVVGVASAFLSVAAGAIAAKVALGGVGKAVSALWDDQNGYNRSLRDAKRALRDLRFEAEQAALSEEEAALALERAREELARVQDLPPDSRARREVELQYQQAELAYRRTKARNKDAREDLKKGPMTGAGAQDPLKNLTASQKGFAKYLVSLKPKLMELREAAASGFLPLLQQGIENVVAKAFPTFKEGLNTLGQAMGEASKTFSSALTNPENLKLLRDFFNSSVPIIKIFGQAAGSAFGGILAVLKAAEPLTLRFATWVGDVALRFEMWAKSGATTTLRDFFTLAGDVAAKLGTVFRKVFDGISNVTKAAFPSGPESGAGGLILKWLDKLGTTFKAFTSGPDFGTWLKGSTDNALTALDTLGKFANIFVKVGSAPETKQFWMTIQGAVPFLQKIVEDGLKAAPLLGEVVVQFVRMFAVLSDSGTLEAFFATLNSILQAFNMFLDVISPILKIFGPLHGVILAVTLALGWFLKGGVVLFGVLEKITRSFGNLQAGMLRVASETLTVKTRIQMLKDSYSSLSVENLKLNKQTLALERPFARLRAAFNMSQRASGTQKRIAMLQEMGRAAKMTSGQVSALTRQLNTAAATGASTMAQLTKSSAMAQKFNLAGSGGRFGGGRSGMVSGAVGTAGLMAGTMTGGGGPASSALGMASMVASFLPGPIGLLTGAALGITGAIVGGFEAAEKAKKEEEAAKRQKEIEITAQNAEITAKNLDTQITTQDALLGAGVKAVDLQAVIDASVGKIKEAGIAGIGDGKTAFSTLASSGFADLFAKGTEAQQTSLLANIKTLVDGQGKTFDQALQSLAPIYEEGGKGAKGVSAVGKYVKGLGIADVKTIKDEATGEVFTGTPEEVAVKKAEWAAAAKQRGIAKNASAKLGPLKAAISELDNFWSFSNVLNDKIWNEDIYTALKIDKDEFSRRYESELTGGVDKSKLKADLQPIMDKYLGELITSTTIKNSPLSQGSPLGFLTPGSNAYVPPAPSILSTIPGLTSASNTAGSQQTTNVLSSTAKSAASLANTTSNLASTIKSWSEKPTYVVLNVGKEVKDADVPSLLDKFVNTGGVSVRRAGG